MIHHHNFPRVYYADWKLPLSLEIYIAFQFFTRPISHFPTDKMIIYVPNLIKWTFLVEIIVVTAVNTQAENIDTKNDREKNNVISIMRDDIFHQAGITTI